MTQILFFLNRATMPPRKTREQVNILLLPQINFSFWLKVYLLFSKTFVQCALSVWLTSNVTNALFKDTGCIGVYDNVPPQVLMIILIPSARITLRCIAQCKCTFLKFYCLKKNGLVVLHRKYNAPGIYGQHSTLWSANMHILILFFIKPLKWCCIGNKTTRHIV